jgi:hypothetical protein
VRGDGVGAMNRAPTGEGEGACAERTRRTLSHQAGLGEVSEGLAANQLAGSAPPRNASATVSPRMNAAATAEQRPESSPRPSPASPLPSITVRSAVAALALLVAGTLWVQRAEVIVPACQISESVPAIPAVGMLLVLVAITGVSKRLFRREAFNGAQMSLIYIFLCIALSLPGCGIVRFFLNTLPVPFHYATPENKLEDLQPFVPSWFVPEDPRVIRTFYDGSPSFAVPWRAWAAPLAWWTAMFVALWVTLFCITVIIRRQWADNERLVFPLLHLPLGLIATREGQRLLPIPFFRDHLMWIGFTVACVYNMLNMANAIWPAVPTWGKYVDLAQGLQGKPWSAVRPLILHFRPEVVGFGYLVSLETCFSIWFFYVAEQVGAVLASWAGYTGAAGFPFQQEQSLGAYVALTFVLLWFGRLHLRGVVRRIWFGDQGVDDSREAIPYRWAAVGGIAGAAFVLGWWVRAGLFPWIAIVYLLLVLMVAFVYSRIRAECGVPMIWMFPYYQQRKAITYLFGGRLAMPAGAWQNNITLATLTFLSRGYFPALQGYQIEGLKLAEERRGSAWQAGVAILLAVAIGLPAAYWSHLSAFYRYGASYIPGGQWGVSIAQSEFEEAVGFRPPMASMDPDRTIATAFGAVVAIVLTIVRTKVTTFPLHPIAYGMATAYGSLVWGPFFLVWMVKWVILKYGGMKLYRRLIPTFLGLALGHFFAAGLVWGVLGATGKAVFQRYGVWFG